MTIIEASNRTGGRIHSSLEFGRNHGYVELGAQWIHGEVANVAFKLANEFGLVDLSETEKVEKFIFQNKAQNLDEETEGELREIFDKVWDDIMENGNDPSQSVGLYANRKFEEVMKM